MLDHVITGDYPKKAVSPAIAREKDQGSEKEAIKNPSPGKTLFITYNVSRKFKSIRLRYFVFIKHAHTARQLKTF